MISHDLELRRYEDNLNVCGIGIIIFGIWDVLKIIMQTLINSKEVIVTISNEIKSYTNGDEIIYILAIILIIILVSALIVLPIFLLHIYTGLNASRAAKRLTYKKGYFVAAVFMLVVSIIGMLPYFPELKKIENIETTVAAIIVDVTNIYILSCIVIYTKKIESLKKIISKE